MALKGTPPDVRHKLSWSVKESSQRDPEQG